MVPAWRWKAPASSFRLDLTRHHLLVRNLEGVLENLKPSHQPRGHRRASVVRAQHGPESHKNGVPVDDLRQPNELMVHVGRQLQAHRPDHRLLVRLRLGFWLHRYTWKWGAFPFSGVQHIEKVPAYPR